MVIIDGHSHTLPDWFSEVLYGPGAHEGVPATLDDSRVSAAIVWTSPSYEDMVCPEVRRLFSKGGARLALSEHSYGPPKFNSEFVECGCGRSWEPELPYHKRNLDVIRTAASRKQGTRLLPGIIVHPTHPKSAGMVEAAVSYAKGLGVKLSSVKFYLLFERDDWQPSAELVGTISGHGLPINFHTDAYGAAHPDKAVSFAEENPDVNVIASHACRGHVPSLRKVGKLDNLYTDISPISVLASPYTSGSRKGNTFLSEDTSNSGFVDFVLDNVGASSCVIGGTDYPWPQRDGRYSECVDELSGSIGHLPASDRFNILYQSALEAYQLE